MCSSNAGSVFVQGDNFELQTDASFCRVKRVKIDDAVNWSGVQWTPRRLSCVSYSWRRVWEGGRGFSEQQRVSNAFIHIPTKRRQPALALIC